MSNGERILAYSIGAVVGAIAWDRTLNAFLGYQRYFGELYDFVLRLLWGGLLGGVGAIWFGELTARHAAKKYSWFAVLLSSVLIPVTFGSIYGLIQRQADFTSEAEYDLAKQWDGQQSLQGFNLSGKDMHGRSLNGADLRDANLRGANFSFARLSAANLTGANLTAANLRGAHLNKADLSEADLSGADLSFANLDGANLDAAHLMHAKYDSATRWPEGFDFRHSGAFGPGADFSGGNLSGAWIYDVDLTGANLSEANMRGSKLRGSILRRANLSGADLSGAELTVADLEEANLSRAKYTSDTRWPEGFDPYAAGANLVNDQGNLIVDPE